MKNFFFAAVIITATTALPLHAQDFFVRPGNTKQPQVDYGIKPKEQPKPVPVPVPNSPQPEPSQPQPKQPAQPLPQPAPQPVQPIPRPVQPAPVSKNDDNLLFGDSTITMVKRGNASIMVSDEDRRPLPTGQGPNELSITTQPGVLGAADFKEISEHLGLNEQQARSSCFVRYQVLIDYGNDRGEAITLYRTNSHTYRFNGPLNGVSIFLELACAKLQPPVSGFIGEQSDAYSIGGGQIKCGALPRNSGTIRFALQATGNGTGTCTIQ